MSKRVCCRRSKLGVVFVLALVALMWLVGSAIADENYVYKQMWPKLQQPWYFSQPRGVAVDGNGNVYVADTFNHRIQKFTSDGKFIATWGSQGSSNGQFDIPYGIAVDGSGNVYVTDIGNNRIQKFTADGKFMYKWGSFGSADGQFNSLRGIAIDGSGNVYVADAITVIPNSGEQWNDRIQKFTSDGKFIAKWGSSGSGDGQFYGPDGIAIDGSGNVYVVDEDNNRVQKFTSDGKFITKWGSQGFDDGQFSLPTGIAIDRSGNVYVTELNNGCIQKFTGDGKFITKWGSQGRNDGQFYEVSGIALDASDNVYIADTENGRIQKFTSDGTFITKWGSQGSSNGQFFGPQGIAVDGSGNIYITDENNHRIQKFNYDGKFITTWGSIGSDDGQFGWSGPYGIAIDGSGNVYVADSYNDRIQKFTSDGKFIAKWGSWGSGDGQLNGPNGIAVDGSGNVYVAEVFNNRIQKFTSDGKFIAKWGSKDNGDVLFYYPWGVAVDDSGNIYVSDTNNNRIQKNTSDGKFIAKWGSGGSGDGQFVSPRGIAVDSSGNVYVADVDNNRIQKFTSDGEFIAKFGDLGSNPGQISYPSGVSISKNGDVYVTDTSNNRIQVFNKEAPTTTGPDKAIIVAGSGPYKGNNLWDATQMNANYAYRAFKYQGFTKDNIYYLTAGRSMDLDNNGVLDDMYEGASSAEIQKAIAWANGANDVIIYLTGHGGEGNFRINETEILKSSDLASWINTLQQSITGKIIVVYDSCQSGSFLNDLRPPAGKGRINITSAANNEFAYFVDKGTISFSYPFWSQIFSGATVYDAFTIAQDEINYMKWKQTPGIDDNGDGIGNEIDDGNKKGDGYLAEIYTIGKGIQSAADIPLIGSVSPDQTLNGQTSAKIRAENVIPTDTIQRVWAIIKRPDSTPSNPDEPVTSLPSIDLTNLGSNTYEGTYSDFNVSGAYEIAVYAMDSNGIISLPKTTKVTQTGGASTAPQPTITANGAKGTVKIKTTDTLSISVALNAGGFSGQSADWWLQALTDLGLYYYDVVGGSWGWQPGNSVTYMGQLFNLGQTEVLRISGLPVGTYSFNFQVDLTMDGKKDGQMYSDGVLVIVSQ
ncbi:MAG: hypothetical protein HQL02_10470 [Nitrospirae bacterium]|nr:hypothetical protein [Nitrospirota bacterium]